MLLYINLLIIYSMEELLKLCIKFYSKFKENKYSLNDSDISKLSLLIKGIIDNDTEFSKYSACNYLNVSRASFDNYVKENKIPKGTHKQGFKELIWYKKDLDNFVLLFKCGK